MPLSQRSRQAFCISDSPSLFVPEWEEPLLARALVALALRTSPTICYVGAAKGDHPDRRLAFYQLAERVNFRPRALNLFTPLTDNPDEYFADADIVYVDGGSTRNLMVLLREWRADQALRDAYDRGVILAGASAGTNMMFEWGLTDSVRTRIDPIAGLGLLPGTVGIHHDANAHRPAAFEAFLKDPRATGPAFSIDDGVALHFVDGEHVGTWKRHQGADWARHSLGTEAAVLP
ncbi:MAG: Type 1 glutamine amidotransferase-like domain-containing protein [Sphingopyxis sp.]|uniref:Type 1 glutamine amidotransferase-like domain-containing protein n=1 Tax=Sphingopyxis sp. TaxID=1908224 RepID=UPI002ABC1A31|nr:Type 1 glutamine amidotransferase-like domain-containing protein [Sphingopyxis sp.]MDZ3833291.1 Type 1 glutamine amidotransferase-like domain-containing protein [Sphingopyxis sp.]